MLSENHCYVVRESLLYLTRIITMFDSNHSNDSTRIIAMFDSDHCYDSP